MFAAGGTCWPWSINPRRPDTRCRSLPQAKVKDLEGQVQILQDNLQTMRLGANAAGWGAGDAQAAARQVIVC